MKRITILAAAGALVATPALGAWAASAATDDGPLQSTRTVRVADHDRHGEAEPGDDRGRQHRHDLREDRAGHHRHAGDDPAGHVRHSGEPEPGDDHGGRGEVEAGDDHGGDSHHGEDGGHHGDDGGHHGDDGGHHDGSGHD